MSTKESAKEHFVNSYKITEELFDDVYQKYSNLLCFLDEMFDNQDLKVKMDQELTNEDSFYHHVFRNLIRIKENDMELFLDYVYVLYSCNPNPIVWRDVIRELSNYLIRLSFYDREHAEMIKETFKYAFTKALETVLVFCYDKVMNSSYVPDYYKEIIRLYKNIYKKYDVLEDGFLSFLLNDSFTYFVRNESIKNDNEKVKYFLTLIYDDYNNFEDVVSLGVPNFRHYQSFDKVYNSISIPKKGIY